MGCVYFSVPVVAGYYLMQYVNGIAEQNLKELQASSSVPAEVKMQNDALKGMLKEWKDVTNNK